MAFSRPPRIGFTLDYETKPTYSKLPWYALRENYCASVERFGAAAFGLSHAVEQVEAYLDVLDGLIITGGAFDIPPAMYGAEDVHETVETKDRRTQFEFAVTKAAIARKMPVLGICGGQQLLNVVLGGSLIQHIPDAVPDALAHEQPNPRNEPGHSVEVKEGTLLHRILFSSPSPLQGEGGVRVKGQGETPSLTLPFSGGGNFINVNSAHHQAVDSPAPSALGNALAPDGVIEGIELPQSAHPFCLGVQWHPEYHVSEADTRIFEAFVAACRTYADGK